MIFFQIDFFFKMIYFSKWFFFSKLFLSLKNDFFQKFQVLSTSDRNDFDRPV